MKPILYTAIAIIAGFFLFQCADRAIDTASVKSGVVESREYHPEYTYTTTTFIHVGDILVPQIHTHYVPEKWTVTFRGAAKSGAERSRTVYVDRWRYDATEIGSQFHAD